MSTILSGQGVPSSATGSDGDIYVDNLSTNIHVKSAGAWSTGVSVAGPKFKNYSASLTASSALQTVLTVSDLPQGTSKVVSYFSAITSGNAGSYTEVKTCTYRRSGSTITKVGDEVSTKSSEGSTSAFVADVSISSANLLMRVTGNAYWELAVQIQSSSYPASDYAATFNSGVYFKSDDATFGPFNWNGRASAGASASYSLVPESASFSAPVAGTAFDGHQTVRFPSTATYPAAKTSPNCLSTELLGLNGTAKSFTFAAIIRPEAAAAISLSGGKMTTSNSQVFSLSDYAGIFMGNDAGVAKIGYAGFADSRTPQAYESTVPYTWPGGFNTWGDVIVVGDSAADTVTVYLNGVAQTTATGLRLYRAASLYGASTIGSLGGGGQVFKGSFAHLQTIKKALTAGEVTSLRAYWKTLYPSLA